MSEDFYDPFFRIFDEPVKNGWVAYRRVLPAMPMSPSGLSSAEKLQA